MNNFLLNYFNILSKKNFENPFIEIKALINNSRNTKNEIIFSNFHESKINVDIFKKSFERRLKLEPISKIFNKKDFWDFTFFVNHSVLDPRPETELIIDTAKKYLINKNQKYKIADLGTGSGCIVVSLIKERPKCTATAIDISIKAINVAKTNAKLHQLENKINFINIDIDKYKSSNYDLIISNPPYINSIELNRLDDDIKLHEPKLALSGGSDGFRNLKKVIFKSKKLLKINGKLIVEIGYKQKDQCKKILNENKFYINKISKDLSGKDRCIVSTKL